METPDANGFVNITWPSKNIPHGGVFHTRVVEPSENTRQFLKVLLEESKLDIAQRQQSSWEARLRSEEAARSAPAHPPRPQVRPKTSRRRSQSAIREVTALDDECYRPLRRGEDRERLKERLAYTMAYGDTQQVPARPPRALKKAPELPSKKQMRNELLTQIRERAEWLAEMEVLGEAAAHEDIIKDQIAERLRALDALGVDSICSSARSSGSGFSTMRSTEPASRVGSVKSGKSGRSTGSQGQAKKAPPRKEEHVSAYNSLPPLQYSPRRRC